jgi:outer membrane protein assembly factor BamC
MTQALNPGKRMRTLKLTALSLAMLTLAGCGSMSLENKRVDYKSAAVKVPTLEVPPDLTTPAAEDHYTIPEGNAAVANYSDFAKGSAPSQARASSVLPESRSVRLERSGAQHWLVVDDKAENVWPMIKAFWQENGLVIKTENQQAGIMETDWAENRAKIPKSGIRSLLGKVLDDLYESGEMDMYRIRLERSKDGNGTEIYLTQYGKEQVLSKDGSTIMWQSRPNDPELEITMMQMLMIKLGGAEAQAQAKAQMEVPSAKGTVAAPKLQTLANGSRIILLSEPFDKSWRTVGLALEHEGFVVEDKDRANGVYFLRVEEDAKEKGWLDKLAFWRDDGKSSKPVRYQVTVHEGSAGCEVAVNNGNGGSNSNTQRIIDALYKALGK